MSFKIISFSENKPELPRIAVLRNQDTGKLIKMYLFPHIDEMASAIGVNDELTKLTDFAMLLATEDNDELGKWKAGAIVEFPF
jgi:hypothetical protein